MPIAARRALWDRIATDLRPRRPGGGDHRGDARHARAGARRDPRRRGPRPLGRQDSERLVELAAELGHRPGERLHRGVGGVGRPEDRRVDPDHARVDEPRPAPRSRGTRPSGGPRTPGRRRRRGRARPRRSRASTSARDRLGPVERVAVAEERRRAVLEQVAGEQDVGVRDDDHDVVVGMAAAEVAQLDRTGRRARSMVAARRTSGRAGRGRPRPAPSASSGIARDRALARSLAGRSIIGSRSARGPRSSPAGRRGCRSVVAVTVGVDDDADGQRRQRPEVAGSPRAWRWLSPRVDDQRRARRRGPRRCSGRRTRSGARRRGRRPRSRRSSPRSVAARAPVRCRASSTPPPQTPSGRGRHADPRPALAGRPASRGPASCWSTAWPSTPAATSTSATSWRRPGSTPPAYDLRGLRRVRRAGGPGSTLVPPPRRPRGAARRRPRERAGPAGRALRPLAGRARSSLGYVLDARGRGRTSSSCRAPALDSTLPGWKQTRAPRRSRRVAPTLADHERLRRRRPVARPRGRASATSPTR